MRCGLMCESVSSNHLIHYINICMYICMYICIIHVYILVACLYPALKLLHPISHIELDIKDPYMGRWGLFTRGPTSYSVPRYLGMLYLHVYSIVYVPVRSSRFFVPRV